jgi:hypothetical protein
MVHGKVSRMSEITPASASPPATRDRITTPGPFAENSEPIGGCWIIEAPDLGAALE